MKPTLQTALDDKGYDSLTPVQQAVSAPELERRDLLVSAQTGSGKTIGFGLAIASAILGTSDHFDTAAAPLALVIAPTRELALQVRRELGWLYAPAGGHLASCVGGMDMLDERRALARGAHIVVATPGRLRDHIMRGSIDLSQVRAVVLDEADEMLDLGFREDLEFILDETPDDRQTLLFSATVPAAIVKLARRYQRDAERISTVSEATQHSDIDYRAHLVAPRDGENAVINVLRFHEAPNAIVFCNTRAMVARLTTRLSNRGFSVVALSGELTQGERSNALQAMRDGRARVCVATDVAARGIDLPKLDLVVHAELPTSHETLLHRSGRTGRAGRKGVSAMIVVPSSRKKAERILKFAKLEAQWSAAPTAAEIDARDQDRMMTSEDWGQPASEAEAPGVEALLQAFTPEQIAAAYLRQYKARHSAPEDLQDMAVDAPKPRAAFGPSVWFSVTEGRNQNASPRHLLPMICKAGGITKDDIGAIRIADDLSFFELRADAAEGFERTLGEAMVIEGSKAVVRMKSAPDIPDFKREKRMGGAKPAHRKGPRPPRPPHPAKVAPPVSQQQANEAGAVDTARPTAPRKGPRSAPAEAQAPAKPAQAPARKPKPKPMGKPGHKPKDSARPPRAASKKGPPPPKGKPSSKKNRARAAAAKTARGGNAPPKRRT